MGGTVFLILGFLSDLSFGVAIFFFLPLVQWLGMNWAMVHLLKKSSLLPSKRKKIVVAYILRELDGNKY